MTVVYIAQPTFRWPSKGDDVIILPPSEAGMLADCQRPDREKSKIIAEDQKNDPKLEIGATYNVDSIEVVTMKLWGEVAKVTLSP